MGFANPRVARRSARTIAGILCVVRDIDEGLRTTHAPTTHRSSPDHEQGADDHERSACRDPPCEPLAEEEGGSVLEQNVDLKAKEEIVQIAKEFLGV